MAFSVECAKGIARRNVVKRWQNVRGGGRYDLPIQLVRFSGTGNFYKRLVHNVGAELSILWGEIFPHYPGKFDDKLWEICPKKGTVVKPRLTLPLSTASLD